MTILVSNATAVPLTIWIEPWCDELSMSPRSVLSLDAPDAGEQGSTADLEIVDDRLVVWATAPGTLVVTIDGREQDTGSRSVPLPVEAFEVPVKVFMYAAFENLPLARLAGAPLPSAATGGSWARLRRWTKALSPAWIAFDRRR